MNRKQIERYFAIAKEVSSYSDYPNIKIGAIIVYKNRVISKGFNSQSTHPMQKQYNIYRTTEEREFDVESRNNGVHAEIACLVAVKGSVDYSKCTMFVYREDAFGNKRISRPCLGCMTALKDYGIPNVYYTTPKGYNYEYIR